MAGNTLYTAGTTSLPAIMLTGLLNPQNGVGFAMTANISPDRPVYRHEQRAAVEQPDHASEDGRFRRIPDRSLTANPDILWPQVVGTLSANTFIQRLLQSEIGSGISTATEGDVVLGGDHALILVGRNAAGTVFSSFSRSDLVVADQGRVSRFDPSGNPIWSTDTTLASTDTSAGQTGDLVGLVRPSRAYLYGDNDVLVVDPGSNKIVHLDASGREVRTIRGFTVDTAFVPDGYQTNEKFNFDSPSDVATFNEYVPGPRLAANPMSSPAPLEYWYHYVVADTGNHRLLDIIDRYAVDPTTRRVLGPVAIGGQAQLGVLALAHARPPLPASSTVTRA